MEVEYGGETGYSRWARSLLGAGRNTHLAQQYLLQDKERWKTLYMYQAERATLDIVA
jgi:hypothetical protein